MNCAGGLVQGLGHICCLVHLMLRINLLVVVVVLLHVLWDTYMNDIYTGTRDNTANDE